MIKAPFNFVPLSEYVFFPEWADQISQDIPFRDGVSGTIQLKMTAKTPVFVRNGHNRNMEETSFSHTPDGKYFIPATSLKGCIRNVLEILGFGKMTFVQNKSFGLRDLNDSSYRMNMNGIHCGWLQRDSTGSFVLYDWGIPKRISIEEIAQHYGVADLSSFITNKDAFSKSEDKDCTSAKYKYDLFVEKGYDISYGSVSSKNLKEKFSLDVSLQENMRKNNPVDRREFYKFGGQNEGYIVLTGQSGVRQQKEVEGEMKWAGKLYEFIFLKPDCENELKVSESIFDAFKTIHEDSPAYSELWKAHLLNGERIPVFFKLDFSGEIHSIGISYMYKYPYSKKIYDAIPSDLCNPEKGEDKEFKKDLADCIFGYSFKNIALKGRVQCGHARANGNPRPMESKKFITLSPHPSYYPIYRKDGRNWNTDGRISGWKRYLVRETEFYKSQQAAQLQIKSDKVDKGVCLLPMNTQFDVIVFFHNLTHVELGALLSAITFHGNQDKCFHSIGFGKPFGYGKIQMTILKLIVDKDGKNEEENPYRYMYDFEERMDKFIHEKVEDESAKWVNAPQLKELFTMANGIGVKGNGDRENLPYYYMTLDEYRTEKRHGKLSCFTSIKGEELRISSIDDKIAEFQEELKERRKKELEEKCKKEEEQEERRKQEEFEPTSHIVGDKVKAHCFDFKKVHVDGYEYDTNLVVDKYSGIDVISLIGNDFDVVIKQISKAGKIVQVKYPDLKITE